MEFSGVGKHGQRTNRPPDLSVADFQIPLQLFEVAVTADFLNHPRGNACVAHLNQGRVASTVGGRADDVGAREGFSQSKSCPLNRGVSHAAFTPRSPRPYRSCCR